MTSSLSRVPLASRRRITVVLAGFAVLFLAVGVVSSTGLDRSGAVLFAVLGYLMAAVLGLTAWGMRRSIDIDRSHQQMRAVVDGALAGQLCDCGVEHDPTEMHITDACAHDGQGAACAHDCASCVLRSAVR